MSVTVYYKLSCDQSAATMRALDAASIQYAAVDLAEDQDADLFIRILGSINPPVVVAYDSHWSGFQPNRISELVGI